MGSLGHSRGLKRHLRRRRTLGLAHKPLPAHIAMPLLIRWRPLMVPSACVFTSREIKAIFHKARQDSVLGAPLLLRGGLSRERARLGVATPTHVGFPVHQRGGGGSVQVGAGGVRMVSLGALPGSKGSVQLGPLGLVRPVGAPALQLTAAALGAAAPMLLGPLKTTAPHRLLGMGTPVRLGRRIGPTKPRL